MTLFLVDISRYQAGLSLAQVKKEGFAAVLARASTGYDGGSKDSEFATFKAAAKKAGVLFGAYHFLYPHGQVPIAHQAAVCAASVGDTSIPVMIDHEPDGSSAPTPSVADATNFAEAMRDKGYRVPLWYLPHWVWQDHLHSPKLPTDTGMQLVSSNYVGKNGYASTLYPGTGGEGWDGYGGLAPVIWQFTDGAKVDGQLVDADAYKGSLDELTALFTGGDDMSKADMLDALETFFQQRTPFHDVPNSAGDKADRTWQWMVSSARGWGYTDWQILKAVQAALDPDALATQVVDKLTAQGAAGTLTVDQVKDALADVLRAGTDATADQ